MNHILYVVRHIIFQCHGFSVSHPHPLKCVHWPVLLDAALGRMFGGSPQFLFVFYRPDRRENVRSESRMVSPTYKRTL